ncbi:MAG: DNA polymerase ligase N-terminal domain-containing protein [Planctomycetales bacterium]
MPRFVILIHDYPHLHWDFMLEKEAALRAWRLAAEADHSGPIGAQPLPEHRLAYLDYEGPVSGGRGTVTLWDQGEYVATVDEDDRVEVELRGKRIAGTARLTRDHSGTDWTFQLIAGSSPAAS